MEENWLGHYTDSSKVTIIDNYTLETISWSKTTFRGMDHKWYNYRAYRVITINKDTEHGTNGNL